MRSSRILFAGGMLALLGLALYLRPGAAPAGSEALQDAGGPARPRRGTLAGEGARAPGLPPDLTVHYDDARPVPRAPGMLGPLAHDAALARVGGGAPGDDGDGGDDGAATWALWLELEPGRGDRLLLARIEDGVPRDPLELEPADTARAHPTLAADEAGGLWIGEEERDEEGGWDVFVRRRAPDGRLGPRLRVSEGAGIDVRHALAPEPAALGGAWLAWQSDAGGELAVLARRVAPREADARGSLEPELAAGPLERASPAGWGSWSPSVAVDRDGRVLLAWDAFTGESFDVLARVRQPVGGGHGGGGGDVGEVDAAWGPLVAVAVGPALQARPRLAPAAGGGAWILWEEGAPRWGARFTTRKEEQPGAGDPTVNELRDDLGPLHRLRTLQLALLRADGGLARPAQPLPLPAVEASRERPKRSGAELLGCFYERGRLVVDGAGRPWVLYRHGWMPTLGNLRHLPHHFFSEGYRVYARCLDAGGWSELLRLDLPQRDGLQRLEAAPLADGCEVAWTVGRADRNHLFAGDGTPVGDDARDPGHGVAFARLALPPRAGSTGAPALLAPERIALPALAPAPAPPAPEQVGGVDYGLAFGDLHRHTDLSFCNSLLDGTLDDAYRYAIEVARLGFLAITDHTWDLDLGEGGGLAWWRSTKEVGRHAVAGRFAPFLGFERSDRDTDHNFVTLHGELAFHHPAHGDGPPRPLPEVWRTLDRDTFTVPHLPFRGRIWQWRDDERRPLLELQQGFRSVVSTGAAREGLEGGHRFGFVASSDHLSTSASFACVWSPAPDRESIFRSLQARRAYAATDRIRLVLRAGTRWMGERLAGEAAPELALEVDGTAPLALAELVLDRGPALPLALEPGSTRLSAQVRAPAADPGAGERWLYLHVRQEDGAEAWSSPLWYGAD